MRTLTDESFGIVPVYQVEGTWQVLLIQQISYRGQEHTFWTLPKGHAETGESGEAAARRELVEETGVTVDHLERARNFKMEYVFKHEEQLIKKIVHFYLGYCTDTETHISHPQEVAALGWFTFRDAYEQVTHENTKHLLREVESFLLS